MRCSPPTCSRTACAKWWRAPVWTRRRSTTSSPAPSPRSATRRSTSPAMRCWAPDSPSRFPAPRSTGSAAAASRRSASPPRASFAGAYDLVVAAGWSRWAASPMGTSVLPGSNPFGDDMTQRYPEGLVPQGISAELIAARWGFSRTAARRVLRRQPRKGRRAQPRTGCFDNELIANRGACHRRDHPARHDGRDAGRTASPRSTTRPMKARFPQINWEITAGNSSPLSDGSAAVLITTSDVATEARPAPAGPHPHHHRRGLRPALHADRRHPGHGEGARVAPG